MPVHTDFNGDGRDDILWQNFNASLVTNWLGQPDGSFVPNDVAGLDPWAPGYFAGSGDFNGDGLTDTLWRNFNGLYLSLTLPGGDFDFNSGAGYVPKSVYGWSIVGTGDFDADGQDDILLRNWSDGWLVQWLAELNYQFSDNTAATTWLHPAWRVVTADDFDNDGRGDVLLRHDDGWLVEWIGQANGSFAANNAATSWIHPTWDVEGTGDFNGDGNVDVLLRHDDGWLVEWLRQDDGTFSENAAANRWLHPAWHLVGVGDYDGDGHHDLLLRHTNGTVTEWLAQGDGTFVDNGAVAAYLVGVNWETPWPSFWTF